MFCKLILTPQIINNRGPLYGIQCSSTVQLLYTHRQLLCILEHFDGKLTYIGVYCWSDRSAGIDRDRGRHAARAAGVEHLLMRVVVMVLLLLQRGWVVMLRSHRLLYNVVLLDRRQRHDCKI